MSWPDLDKVSSPEAKQAAEKVAEQRRLVEVALAQAYHRLYNTDDGKLVLTDLYKKMVINNTPDKTEPNIDYMAAYCDGESGTVSYIQAQITRAEVI